MPPGVKGHLFAWLVIINTWLVSQGTLGACAILGTSVILKRTQHNNLSEAEVSQDRIQQNRNTAQWKERTYYTFDTFDLTDRNLLIIRTLMGILFAVLLGLPFAAHSLNGLSDVYWGGNVPDYSTLEYLFIPFVAGFSTDLVLVILGRFIVAIQSIFGSTDRT